MHGQHFELFFKQMLFCFVDYYVLSRQVLCWCNPSVTKKPNEKKNIAEKNVILTSKPYKNELKEREQLKRRYEEMFKSKKGWKKGLKKQKLLLR